MKKVENHGLVGSVLLAWPLQFIRSMYPT